MRLKQKALFLIGGLAVISAVSSQNYPITLVTEVQQQPSEKFNIFHKSNSKNQTPLMFVLNPYSNNYFSV